ncbi:MAG: exodeoxyribonuclease V subunit gamma, partial [Duodenibacillus sp.]|nr:exodeoxyribonuclease V subunit gamma [Duodenibacillus sp.]
MIQTIFSNSYETHREILLNYLDCDRKGIINAAQESLVAGMQGCAGFFKDIQVIVPSDAITDDLQRAIARRKGICAGVEFQHLTKWYLDKGGFWLGSSFTGQELEWRIWHLLSDNGFLGRPDCARLKGYVEKKTPAERYAFAKVIARALDRYASYRLDWMLAWMGVAPAEMGVNIESERYRKEQALLAAHPDFGWQRELVSELAAIDERLDDPERKSPGILGLRKALRLYKNRPLINAPDDVESVHIFLPEQLVPSMLPCLRRQGSTHRVYLYLFNPSRQYWFDSFPKALYGNPEPGDGSTYLRRNAASTRALIERAWRFGAGPETARDIPSLDEEEGEPAEPRQTRRLQAFDASALNTFRAENVDQVLCGVDPGGDTLLRRLQRAMLEDDESLLPDAIDPGDRSVAILKAADLTRQIEATVSWAEKLIAGGMSPADILVATPDIDAAAPAIHAVMAALPPERRISYQIAGLSMMAASEPAQALLAACRFVRGRADIASFDALIGHPLLADSWDLSADDIAVLHRWLATAGYRYGIDARHMAGQVKRGAILGDDEACDGTLERALERLALGQVMQPGSSLGDTLGLTGTEQQGFEETGENGGLMTFLLAMGARLSKLAAAPGALPSFREWHAWLQKLADQIFPEAWRNEGARSFLHMASQFCGTADEA